MVNRTDFWYLDKLCVRELDACAKSHVYQSLESLTDYRCSSLGFFWADKPELISSIQELVKSSFEFAPVEFRERLAIGTCFLSKKYGGEYVGVTCMRRDRRKSSDYCPRVFEAREEQVDSVVYYGLKREILLLLKDRTKIVEAFRRYQTSFRINQSKTALEISFGRELDDVLDLGKLIDFAVNYVVTSTERSPTGFNCQKHIEFPEHHTYSSGKPYFLMVTKTRDEYFGPFQST